MTSFYTLASSSAGNCMLLSCDGTHLLIDAGISCRRMGVLLHRLHLSFEDLGAILVTHEHADHIGGLKTLLKKYNIPVYASPGTLWALEQSIPYAAGCFFPMELLQPMAVGSCSVTPFPTNHDAVESVGYRIDTPDGTVGILTDCGRVPEAAGRLLSGAELLVLESNYDESTLRAGPYPYHLKQRILGMRGHLSNEMAADFAAQMAQKGTGTIVLAHLSKENNDPQLAWETVQQRLLAVGCPADLTVAPRDELSKEFQLCRRSRSFVSEN